MGSLNSVQLIGHLGADPELRYTKSKAPVCNLRLATSFKTRAGESKTQWHRVVTWNADAENCAKYLKKGRLVYVQGRMETREWEDGGVKKYITEVVADRVVFLPGDRPANDQAPRSDPFAAEGPGEGDDNVPW